MGMSILIGLAMKGAPLIIKLIRVEVISGHRDRFLAAQEIWDRECLKTEGYLGQWRGDGDPGEVHVLAFWASRAAYERRMTEEHDRIAALAGSEGHYSALEVRIAEEPSGFPAVAGS
jgi:hypothetical protein